MLTIGDLLAPQKGGLTKAGPPRRPQNEGHGGGAHNQSGDSRPKPATKVSTAAVAGSLAVSGTSDFDRTLYPQPARSLGTPPPPAPPERPDPDEESPFDPVLSLSEPPRWPQNAGHGGGAHNQSVGLRPIDPATSPEVSLVELTNIGLTAEAMAADA